MSQTVWDAVNAAVAGFPRDWRVEAALALAGSLDDAPNASSSRELRALMADIEDQRPAREGTTLDELQRRRAARSAAS